MPSDDLAHSVLESIFKLFEREVEGESNRAGLRKMIYVALSKLAHIPAIHQSIKEKISKLVSKSKSEIDKYLDRNNQIEENTENFLSNIFELVMNFNLLVSNRPEAPIFYDRIVKLCSNFVYPNRDTLGKDILIQAARCVNSMYVWISDYIISKQDMMVEDNQALTDLTGLFINIIKFYKVVFEDRKN